MRRHRGMTLTELLIAMTILAFILVVIAEIYTVGLTRWTRRAARNVAQINTTTLMDSISREAGRALRFETLTIGSVTAYVFTMPLDTDSSGNYIPSRTSMGLVYRDGPKVAYYLSNTTGATSVTGGTVLWRATAPVGSLTFTPDTAWSLDGPGTPRYNGVQAFAIANQDALSSSVNINLTMNATEGQNTVAQSSARSVNMKNSNGAQTDFTINSRGSFYRLGPGDGGAQSPLIINLASLNLQAGDVIRLEVTGGFRYNSSYPDSASGTAFVFSSTNTILAGTNVVRVSGAIASDAPRFTSWVTYPDSLATEINEDFGTYSSITVTIPNSANFLFVCPVDGFYGDNLDSNNDYKVRITQVE